MWSSAIVSALLTVVSVFGFRWFYRLPVILGLIVVGVLCAWLKYPSLAERFPADEAMLRALMFAILPVTISGLAYALMRWLQRQKWATKSDK